jgi:hypothetical protein
MEGSEGVTLSAHCATVCNTMPAVRVSEDVHQQIAVVAASEGRSAANWLDWTLRPILAAALGDESANGAVDQEPSTTRMASERSPVADRASAVPPARSAPARSPRNPALTRQAKLNKAKGL